MLKMAGRDIARRARTTPEVQVGARRRASRVPRERPARPPRAPPYRLQLYTRDAPHDVTRPEPRPAEPPPRHPTRPQNNKMKQ